jgi:hypothetical protein
MVVGRCGVQGFNFTGVFFGAGVLAFAYSCSSSDNSQVSSGRDASDMPNVQATCSTPGTATPGPADEHCFGQAPQPVETASCWVDGGMDMGDDGGMDMEADGGMDMGDDGGAVASCDYGATMYGMHGNDDDCKYWVSWTSDPICAGANGVRFTVSVWSNVDGTPVTGIPTGILPEAFITSGLDAACDNHGSHYSPGSAASPYLTEVAPGSGIYSGPVVFDIPGEWTVRFHLHQECVDVLPTSPHGHAAFHITVP